MNKEKRSEIIGAIIAVVLLLILVVVFIFINDYTTDAAYNKGWADGWEVGEAIDDLTPYHKMRDLFTPMFNDTVTIEHGPYLMSNRTRISNGTITETGGFTFWVNHTRVLSSYWFDNQKSYLVLIGDDIEVIGGE